MIMIVMMVTYVAVAKTGETVITYFVVRYIANKQQLADNCDDKSMTYAGPFRKCTYWEYITVTLHKHHGV